MTPLLFVCPCFTLGLFVKHVVAWHLYPGTSQHISKFLGNMGVICFTKLSVWFQATCMSMRNREICFHGTNICSIFVTLNLIVYNSCYCYTQRLENYNATFRSSYLLDSCSEPSSRTPEVYAFSRLTK